MGAAPALWYVCNIFVLYGLALQHIVVNLIFIFFSSPENLEIISHSKPHFLNHRFQVNIIISMSYLYILYFYFFTSFQHYRSQIFIA